MIRLFIEIEETPQADGQAVRVSVKQKPEGTVTQLEAVHALLMSAAVCAAARISAKETDADYFEKVEVKG